MPYRYATLDEAQTALADVLFSIWDGKQVDGPLITGNINTQKETFAVFTLASYALSRTIGAPGAVLQPAVAHADMVAMLKQWQLTGNPHVEMIHPNDSTKMLGINWGQLLQTLLPILLQVGLKILPSM